ncbi:uroporphyrinogen-III synthase [Qipengyuania sp.]|uniref:uroporphyrinogen-III synthase n=1 Tax=Qipengyuania sp. TaxID=2004515 RepID=UPI0035C817A2
MPRPLAILRPQPGWDSTAELARSRGIAAIGHPLSAYEPIAWSLPDGAFDAILAGSAAVFRHGGPALAQLRGLPVLAVGKSTADAARGAGFRVAATGRGGLQTVLETAGNDWPRLLRLMGDERVDLEPMPGQQIEERVVYRVRSVPLETAFASEIGLLRPVIALHSAATARHFRSECQRLGIDLPRLELLALGPRIAEAAGEGWLAVHSAETPSDAALIGKAAALCK